ncbi:MAG: efflux RND transporter permease subunit, partial [Chloroflexi bacterium]|nr:efflux RND transporter permease subunit [Chloroflexota bacterium]
MTRSLRIGGAQLDLIVGDLAGNESAILHAMEWAEKNDVDVLILPELAISGYPPEDLVLRPGFVDENLAVLDRLASQSGSTATVVGFVDRLPGSQMDDDAVGRSVTNAAAVIANGEIKSIYHKNLLPVTYVTADVAGKIESPVYAMLEVQPRVAEIDTGGGYEIEQHTAGQPSSGERYALKWDGEWHITIEVFRDLSLAFCAVLVLIYMLMVGWFKSYVTPLVVMAAIPFSLVGIFPAHWGLGAFFTATSMIGFMAGAGIVVRNSIILVDFIELRMGQGLPLAEAVVEAGAVRFRPMLLTALAVIVGASVIMFDPIFQGLAIS